MIPAIILAIENDDDREFMIYIYVELYPMMKATAFKIVKDDAVSKDIVHDTVVALIRNLGTIRAYERKRLVSYVKKAVHNTSLNYYNKHLREGNHTFYGFEDDLYDSIADDASSPIERFEALEEYEELGKAIKLLSERDRDLLYMKYNMVYDDETIGKIMGIKKESVRQYLTRARRNAKKCILKEGAIIE
jgi:RNA polymerase sigma-70 factor (ECF subfamily)